MLLDGKNAVIYGGGGSIGGAMARAFAREGATVHLAGRTQATLDRAAETIRSSGGRAETAVVDALDESQVDAHADRVAADFGSLDLTVNVISTGDVQGTPLAEMSFEDFNRPIHNLLRSTFLTWRAAARHMIRQRSGVILAFGGDGDPIPNYNIGGFQISLSAIESMRRQMASELGQYGVRVVSLTTGGIMETVPNDFEGFDKIAELVVGPTMLKRAADLADVGNVAAFAASDWAKSITGSAINISCGAILD
jgi:NAD(P)-dependent dehydrogenase (short-subunit alcohol dehydrogenase family)